MTLEEGIKFVETAAVSDAFTEAQRENCEKMWQIAAWLTELKELKACVKSTAFQDGHREGRSEALKEVIGGINGDYPYWLSPCDVIGDEDIFSERALRQFVILLGDKE